MKGLFITGTGTGVGKTWVTRGLARAMATRGQSPRGIKPIETGVTARAEDAVAIAQAAKHALIERDTYRACEPAAPLSITLKGDHDPLIIDLIVRMIARESRLGWPLVEGAGGLLVPLTPTDTIADLAQATALPLLIVTRDELGTLSHTLAAVECAQRRQLDLRAIVLTQCGTTNAAGDNGDVLTRLVAPLPVIRFRTTDDDDDALAEEARRSGLLALALSQA